MLRREFIAWVGGAALFRPLAARAQQPAVPVIGFLHPASLATLPKRFLTAFHQGLGETGYVEGRNVAIEYRWAEDQYDRLPALAADLVRRQVAVIATPDSTPATLAAKAATPTIPIAFYIGLDPVEIGLVNSLNRPNGNVTGVAFLAVELASKRLELLHTLIPATDLIAVMVNPINPVYTDALVRALQTAAQALGVRLLVVNASSQSGIEAAFESLLKQRAGALVITGDTFLKSRQNQIAALAAHHKVPTIEQTREFVAAGGLMNYGADYQDAYRLVGNYTGRILKGEKPGDLPVQLATKIELAINLKTARSLGLTVPETLLAIASEVIE